MQQKLSRRILTRQEAQGKMRPPRSSEKDVEEKLLATTSCLKRDFQRKKLPKLN